MGWSFREWTGFLLRAAGPLTDAPPSATMRRTVRATAHVKSRCGLRLPCRLPGAFASRHAPVSPHGSALRGGEGAVGGAVREAVRFLARLCRRVLGGAAVSPQGHPAAAGRRPALGGADRAAAVMATHRIFLESLPMVAPPSLAAQNRCRLSSPLRGEDVVTRFFPGKEQPTTGSSSSLRTSRQWSAWRATSCGRRSALSGWRGTGRER